MTPNELMDHKWEVRELRAEIERLRAECKKLRNQLFKATGYMDAAANCPENVLSALEQNARTMAERLADGRPTTVATMAEREREAEQKAGEAKK